MPTNEHSFMDLYAHNKQRVMLKYAGEYCEYGEADDTLYGADLSVR